MGETRAPTRRSFLRRGAVVAAGAIGLSRAGAAVAGPLGAGIPFQLTGRFFRLVSPRGFGELPQPGDNLSAFGELLDSSGARVGEFYSSVFYADAPLGEGTTAATFVEHHTFRLTDGTVFGSGTRPSLIDSSGTYAFVGGTGRYAALTGTYSGKQDFVELGGDGTAAFAMTVGV